MRSYFSKRFHLTTWLCAAIALATLMLAGCACDDADWKAIVPGDAEATAIDPPHCDYDNLDQSSKSSAALAERADPNLLAIARLEAERDCYKAAEARARRQI